ncbi:hypothetical protein [Xenorhabdus stockiae]|uniref:hypothetical protein n=1 Tax=Xenorhabdus stockiae TaxID=351614 RepID=UPI001472A406|nr:hypothetical protein [Xenorhabdus stockiae]
MPSQRLASGERQEPLSNPLSIDNYATGVNERSQQRGSLKDDEYNVLTNKEK